MQCIYLLHCLAMKALVSSVPMHSLTRTFAAHIHRVWMSMWINSQTGDMHLKMMISLQPSENCKSNFRPHYLHKSK